MRIFSFIIPVRIDTVERFENIECSVKYIKKYFSESEIIIVENSSRSFIQELLKQYPDIRYIFSKNEKEFSKSKALNAGALIAQREFLVIYDLDVLIHPDSLIKSAEILSRGIKKIILPHNTIFVNVMGETRKKIVNTLDISQLPVINSLNKKPGNTELKAYPIPSGVVIFDKEVFLKHGGYNKNMISYGWEDIEILKRMSKLGYYPYILGNYNIIHLDHQRGPDSKANEYYEKNRAEFLKVVGMSYQEITTYVNENLSLDLYPDFSVTIPKRKNSFINQIRDKISSIANRFSIMLQIRGIFGTVSYVLKK